MAKQETEENLVPFTVLIAPDAMKIITTISAKEDRTKGYVIREAITQYLNNRKRRGKE